MSERSLRDKRSQRGMVTAETAVLLPTLILFATVLAWLVSLGIAQVRLVDAARDAARALARSEPSSVATELAQQSAPDGARVHLHRAEGTVEVEVTYQATPPGGVLDGLTSLELRATASTPTEVTDAGQ